MDGRKGLERRIFPSGPKRHSASGFRGGNAQYNVCRKGMRSRTVRSRCRVPEVAIAEFAWCESPEGFSAGRAVVGLTAHRGALE